MTPEKNMPINVSIIIPCYNEETTISPLLDAILAQTYPTKDMEVIIADGGSTDGTLQAIKTWQGTHPDLKIKVVENTEHGHQSLKRRDDCPAGCPFQAPSRICR